MSLDQLDRLYVHIAEYYRQFGPLVEIELDWQGGEALLLPPDFYWQTLERQQRIFGDLSVFNAVQTNLTCLTEDWLHLLKDGFDAVGVSLDLFGGLRLFESGKDSQPRVLANLDRLREHKIDFGCITVLTKRNLHHIRQIYQFYEALKVNSFRILPLVRGAFENQHQDYEISTSEVITAFKTLFEQMLSRPEFMRIDPLSRWIDQVRHHHLPQAQPGFYDKREWESIYLVNTNGDVFSYADAYQSEWCHGNLFQSSMQDIVLSEAHQKAITAAERRMAAVCHNCRFFGSCDGYPIAEESVLHQPTNPPDCGVEKQMLAYIERRLLDIGVLEPRPCYFLRSTHPKLDPSALYRGIQIEFAQPEISQETARIQLSHGTIGAFDLPIDGLRYHPGALVPQEPWREPTPEEYSLLVNPDCRCSSELAVTMLRIPDWIRAPLEERLDQFEIRDRWDPNCLERHLDIQPMMNAINHFLQAQLEEYQPDLLTLYFSPPGLKTLTKVDNRERRLAKAAYLGLHLDSWDRTLRATSSVKQRLCLNLGREERHFLFINLPLPELLTAVGMTQPAVLSNADRTLFSGHRFMKLYPSYPVVKLRLAPGEAYIAPTSQIIHDGTSVGKRYPDVTLHALGSMGKLVSQT